MVDAGLSRCLLPCVHALLLGFAHYLLRTYTVGCIPVDPAPTLQTRPIPHGGVTTILGVEH